MHCIFCEIIAGRSPSQRIAEDMTAVAFMDINPATPGHALVVPRGHAADVFDVSPEVLADLARMAQRVARAMRAALGCAGVNLVQSSGRAAFQSVFHIHVHVVPRYPGDAVRLPWIPRPGEPAAIAAAAEKLRASFG
jgi:histidine triad (HIT) family protein